MKSDFDTVFVNIDPSDHRLDYETANDWVFLLCQEFSELRGEIRKVIKPDRLILNRDRRLFRSLRLKIGFRRLKLRELIEKYPWINALWKLGETLGKGFDLRVDPGNFSTDLFHFVNGFGIIRLPLGLGEDLLGHFGMK